jgi:hypothetical protein
MAEVHVLPGVERRDLVCGPAESDRILHAALDEGLSDVAVIGRDRRGELYVASGCSDVDRTVGLLMRAVARLTEATIVNDAPLDTDPPA